MVSSGQLPIADIIAQVGLYNLLEYDGDCPFCGVRWRFVAHTYFGWRDVLSYAVGDVFVWHPGGDLRVRGLEARPDDGTGVGPGYVLCPICDGDFYVHVRIEKDVIVGVDVDYGRPGAGGKVPPVKEPERASVTDVTEMTTSEVLRFLRANQPLPDDGELQEAELRALSDVVRFLSENQLDEAVPLLLRVFGEGSGFGVYQLVEGAVVRQRRDLVVTELGRALSEPQGNPYWLLHAATAVPDVSFRDEVVRLSGHEDADIRCAAISALEAIGDAVAWQALRHRMTVETDPHVYEALVDALRAGGA